MCLLVQPSLLTVIIVVRDHDCQNRSPAPSCQTRTGTKRGWGECEESSIALRVMIWECVFLFLIID